MLPQSVLTVKVRLDPRLPVGSWLGISLPLSWGLRSSGLSARLRCSLSLRVPLVRGGHGLP